MATNTTLCAGTMPVRYSELLSAMDREWAELNLSPTVSDLMNRWAAACPVLQGLDSPAEVIERIDATRGADQDAIFAGLLALFAAGERLAGRTLLQAMIPALATQVRRAVPPRGISHDEQLQRVIVEFWDVISRPRTLSHGIAGRLSLDTLKKFTAHRRSSDVWESLTDYADDDLTGARTATVDGPEAALEIGPDADLFDLLTSYRRNDSLSAEDAQLLVDIYLVPNDDKNLAETATRLGLSHAALRKRVSRVKSRLLEAVLADQDNTHTASAAVA